MQDVGARGVLGVDGSSGFHEQRVVAALFTRCHAPRHDTLERDPITWMVYLCCVSRPAFEGAG